MEVHFTIGESLLMCCQSVNSPESRDVWNVAPEEFPTDLPDDRLDNNLDWFLDELLTLASQPHPNTKQASCIWLLAVLKGSILLSNFKHCFTVFLIGCGKRKPIESRIQMIQNTFMRFLCENNGNLVTIVSFCYLKLR